MRPVVFGPACLVLASVVCGCTTEPRKFGEECAAVRSRFASAGGRVLSESSPQKRGEALQAASSYMFDRDIRTTLARTKRVLPQEYRLVRETADELNYARTDGGDSIYVSVQFSPVEAGKTWVGLMIKALPS
jgi:hypothetical protein